jgi:hypothetical protein
VRCADGLLRLPSQVLDPDDKLHTLMLGRHHSIFPAESFASPRLLEAIRLCGMQQGASLTLVIEAIPQVSLQVRVLFTSLNPFQSWNDTR